MSNLPRRTTPWSFEPKWPESTGWNLRSRGACCGELFVHMCVVARRSRPRDFSWGKQNRPSIILCLSISRRLLPLLSSTSTWYIRYAFTFPLIVSAKVILTQTRNLSSFRHNTRQGKLYPDPRLREPYQLSLLLHRASTCYQLSASEMCDYTQVEFRCGMWLCSILLEEIRLVLRKRD